MVDDNSLICYSRGAVGANVVKGPFFFVFVSDVRLVG